MKGNDRCYRQKKNGDIAQGRDEKDPLWYIEKKNRKKKTAASYCWSHMSAVALLDRSLCSQCAGIGDKVVHFRSQPETTTCGSTGEKASHVCGEKSVTGQSFNL